MPAQGNALGKGKNPSHSSPERARQPHGAPLASPFQGWPRIADQIPRALPWAGLFRAFQAKEDQKRNFKTYASGCQIRRGLHLKTEEPEILPRDAAWAAGRKVNPILSPFALSAGETPAE
jgi:hypothetical protein